MNRPAPVSWGPKPYRDRDAEILDYIEASQPVDGIGTKIIDGPKGKIINVPPSGPSAAATAPSTHAFQPYKSRYTGSGDPPSNQALRLRIRPGVAGTGTTPLLPSNINSEFTVADDSLVMFWLKLSLVHTGDQATPTALVIEQGEDLPSSDSGNEPATVYLPLFFVSTSEGAITSFSVMQRSNAYGGMWVTNWSCSQVWRQWTWASGAGLE